MHTDAGGDQPQKGTKMVKVKQSDRITNDKLGLNFFKGGIDVM